MLPAPGESPETRDSGYYRDTRVKGDGGFSEIIGQGQGDQAAMPVLPLLCWVRG